MHLSNIAAIVACCSVISHAVITGPIRPNYSFGSPSVIKEGSEWYAFATNSHGSNVPMMHSSNFADWSPLDIDALPDPGKWTIASQNDGSAHTWAPDVSKLSNGKFIMYYSSVATGPHENHCVGAAIATNVTGPYNPQAAPLFCDVQTPGNGDIDTNSLYVASTDERFVLYKNGSANSASGDSRIYLQQVKADGFTPIGKGVQLVHANKNGPRFDVEGPVLVENPEGGFVLLYNTGFFQNTDYQTRFATAMDIRGPYVEQGVLVKSGVTDGVNLTSPGGWDMVPSNVSQAVFYAHANGLSPAMYLAEVKYTAKGVQLA